MNSDNSSHEIIVCILVLVVLFLGIVANRSEHFGMQAPGTLSARLRGSIGETVLGARLRGNVSPAGGVTDVLGARLRGNMSPTGASDVLSAQINTLEHFGGAVPSGEGNALSARLRAASNLTLGNLGHKGKEHFTLGIDPQGVKNATKTDSKMQIMKGFLVK